MEKGRISQGTCCDRLLIISGENSVKFIPQTEMNSRWAKYFKVKKKKRRNHKGNRRKYRVKSCMKI